MLPLRSPSGILPPRVDRVYWACKAKHRPEGVFDSRRNRDVGLFCGCGQVRCGMRRSIELLLDLADDVP